MPTYSKHTDAMSDVVLENTLDISAFLNKPFYQVYFVLGVYIFFLLLNYQIIATEKILKFVLKNLFWSMRSRISRILYL